MEPTVVTVFLAALVTALATGLGALPLIFVRSAGRTVLGASNAVAAGVMLAACVTLSWEGADRSLWRTAVGVALGIVFVLASERYLAHDHVHTLGSLRGEDARRALLIVGVMTVHSAAEGIGVGAAFGGGSALWLTDHGRDRAPQHPRGTCDKPRPRATRNFEFGLLPAGASSRACLNRCLPFPLSCLSTAFDSILPVGLGFAAGAMLWMVLKELLPEALAAAPRHVVAIAGGTAFSLMLCFQVLVLS